MLPIAVAAGAAWLSVILLTDAVVSPADTGLIFMATTARLSYALGEDDALPDKLTKTNKSGIPIYSLLLAFAAYRLNPSAETRSSMLACCVPQYSAQLPA